MSLILRPLVDYLNRARHNRTDHVSTPYFVRPQSDLTRRKHGVASELPRSWWGFVFDYLVVKCNLISYNADL